MLLTPDARVLMLQEKLMEETCKMEKEGCNPFEMAIMLAAAAESHLMLNHEDIDQKIQYLDYMIDQFKQIRKALKRFNNEKETTR